jgi:ferric-dicitrate binding protein FerR (iron transport regulator)
MENRKVHLIGEAYFEVKHDSVYSFVVHTARADIIDLGTTFNVKAYKESSVTETTLIEGALEVVLKDKHAKRIRIRPNQKVVLQHGPAASRTAASRPEQVKVIRVVPFAQTQEVIETAWLDDKLIFRGQRFDDLAREMERKYNVQIAITDHRVKDYRLTGMFRDENIKEALELLQVIVPFKFKIDKNEITIEK